ncbi:MAG: GTPase ObgE [Candidatus Pacebacteria bacterium]|nr:GTPase ObgE [Candidatus Paceibacterota bacterium]MBP9851510.1 GTPase ObgE [Candidatus Paceibacterota bacterium]
MAFIDEISFHGSAGRGGNGVVRWRQEKFIPKGGPAGGDGGRGGDFYAVGVRDIGILAKYKSKTKFAAENGEDGGKKSLHGAQGDDFLLELPVGSIIKNLNSGEEWELSEEGQKVMLLKGGFGGFGNEHFKSSRDVAPKKANAGGAGEEGEFHVELQLFADMGLVGLPNAGKSSLLNMVTNAKAKVADYAFTTLDPNLGDFYGFIIADIPGIIEGAAEGKGLGIKFLRHVKRTKMLAHLVSFENEDMMGVYKEIRKELAKYDKENKLGADGLSEKEEIIILTKTDVSTPEIVAKKVKEFQKLKKKVFTLSLYDDNSVKTFSGEISKILSV